ncbi:SDR family oxidoreductase [Alpinimonas psychrophila]|uniref:3-oxoacyl-[acyl-carrier protein] reductase n=1 Tax=Alpinimonas psychrophila TaxID=748908 RepID=A0A7W3PNY7_9MICO|nr:SDR family oxidoreductase [Alpinimonas psychrophila]MBA8828917.1 3-oxoacyl-[acyl-carrier protein] reductase [Alpinimonas psychrophila]
MSNLSSRAVVISGGGSGIGRAAAEWFSAAGDSVWIVGRRREVLERVASELGAGVHPVVADLSRVEGAETVRAELDGIDVDVVVASAGGTAAALPEDLAGIARKWNADLQQNLLTAVMLVESLRPYLRRPGGRVIGLGSIGAQLGSGYGGSYGAAKAALHAWIYWLAQDLGRDGITANLVVPGYIPNTEFFGDRVTAEFDEVRVQRSLIGRAGTSAEIAASIGFLASADAGYITGQLLGVNGGMVLGR